MSWGVNWKYHRSLPVLASSLTSESVYRFGPGRLEPHGYLVVPRNGAGFETPRYRFPWLSKLGGYHWPPPELIVRCRFDHRFVGTSSHFHLVAPVRASSAQR